MPQEVINILNGFENTKEYYYRVRSEDVSDPAKKAAGFIYLNQTSYNGIYRVNLNGVYNVPYGYRSKPFLEKDKLNMASNCLQAATITCDDFSACQQNILENDLIFLDPPYTVSHNNNGFIKYNQKLFSLDDQRRLRQLVDTIKERNAYYILTNAAHPVILEIFGAGDNVIELHRANLIGGQNAQRGQVSEYIFTNIPGVEI
jgi:DNA adenine methylase